MKGAVYVAFGANAAQEATVSAKTLKEHNPRLGIKILKELDGLPAGLSGGQQAHLAKASADAWSPFEPTLLIDADTRVKGDLTFGFRVLKEGWEVVMVPSVPDHSGRVLWHLKEPERQMTFQMLGTWRHVMLNTGLIFFRKTPNVRRLFQVWREEWFRFKDRDQGALLRALRHCPVYLWLLGKPYNSTDGEIVEHLFGRAK